MKPPPLLRAWLPVSLLTLAAAVAEAALVAGGTAYTNRLETKVLAEPRPLAAAAGKIGGVGRKLKIEEVQGVWYRVSDGQVDGWVFHGSVAAAKPEESKGADGMGLAASETTASAAARPLTPAAEEYAGRRNLGSARGDVDWLNSAAAEFDADRVESFLKAHKKGEYQ